MQSTYHYVNFIKQQADNEKRKKDELMLSPFFKMLEKDNAIEYKKLIFYLEDKTCEEIENLFKYILHKKSIQKFNNF